jgi:hypothetical protein
MSGHIHWSSQDQKFGKEMIAWNAISRLLQQGGIPARENAKQVIALAVERGTTEATDRLEQDGECDIKELMNDSDYILGVDASETVLLNMSETPEQRKAIKDICQIVVGAYEESASKATRESHFTP